MMMALSMFLSSLVLYNAVGQDGSIASDGTNVVIDAAEGDIIFRLTSGDLMASDMRNVPEKIHDVNQSFVAALANLASRKELDDAKTRLEETVSNLTSVSMTVSDLTTQVQNLEDAAQVHNKSLVDLNDSFVNLGDSLNLGLEEITGLKLEMKTLKDENKELLKLLNSTNRVRPAYPKNCKEYNLTSLQSGIYDIYPDGTSSNAISVQCLMLADPTTGHVNGMADWTVIASLVEGVTESQITNFNENYGMTPSTTSNGAIKYFFQTDLTKIANEIYTVNNHNQAHTFKIKDFDGALIFDGPNFIAAADNRNTGIIAGKDFPVVTHYQVESACLSATCYLNDTSLFPSGTNGFSNGLVVVLDWRPTLVSVPNPDFKSVFGGTALMHSRWSHPGTLLAIR